MTSDFKQTLTDNYNAVIHLSMSAESFFVFAIGLGRYRTILFLGSYFLLKAILSYSRHESKLIYIFFLPIFLFSLSLDITNGQIIPVFPKLHFAVTIMALIVTDLVFGRGFVNKNLQNLSNNNLFQTCPKCNYDNKTLVNQCVACFFNIDNDRNVGEASALADNINIDSSLLKEREKYRKGGLFKQPSKKITKLLALDANEFMLICMRVFPFKGFFKDGGQEIASHLILTSKRCIFIHSVFFSEGWRLKETIPYDEITEVTAYKKQVLASKEPILSINTNNANYRLEFRSIFPHRSKIDGIIDCIKKRMPNVKVTYDLA